MIILHRPALDDCMKKPGYTVFQSSVFCGTVELKRNLGTNMDFLMFYFAKNGYF